MSTTESTLFQSPAVFDIPAPHTSRDLGRFAASAAIYFMDGYSDVRFRILASGEVRPFLPVQQPILLFR
jgi:hypothetical protein